MDKEVHVINGKGRMGQCDHYPKFSIQIVEPEGDVRWTKNRRDSIHPDIGSDRVDTVKIGQICVSCENVFTSDAEFHSENECTRCFERRTVIDRN